MARQKHIIGKVAIDLVLKKEEGHFSLQQRWADILKNRISPALSELFDKHVPPNEIWKVDKLTIDLGMIHEKISDRAIAEIIVQQAKSAFENYRDSANGHLEKLPVEMAELEALVFYLNNGHLPQNALDMDVGEVFRKNIKGDFSGFMALLKKQLGSSDILLERVAKRMAWQLPESDLLFFLEKIISQKKYGQLKELPDFYKGIKRIKSNFSAQLKELFWVVFLIIFFDSKLNKKELGGLFYKKYVIEVAGLNIDKKIVQKIKKEMPENMASILERQVLKKQKKGAENESVSEEDGTAISEGIFAKNAGVVLLHPFIPRFFSSVSLLEEDGKSFKSKREAEEAAHWLHYLSTGQEDAPEHELTLTKFLCGLKLNAPIHRGGSLNKEGKEEAEAMLQAAINHWKALKNTSPDGLREGFLQRQGRLTKKQNGHLLEIENKAQDILLGQLPWGLSIVHFPWIKNPLWVQWA